MEFTFNFIRVFFIEIVYAGPILIFLIIVYHFHGMHHWAD